MKRLVLVRHGETIWHAEDRYAGTRDVPMTEQGLRQADQLAVWAAHAGLSGLWCSPLSRARQTLAPTALRLALPLQIEPGLAELDFGAAEGLTRAEIMLRFPLQYANFERDPVTHFLPSGEDPTAAIDRGLKAIHRILGEVDDSARILVISHSTLLRLLLCHLLGIPTSRYRRLFPKIQNVSLTEIGFAPAGPALLQFNVPLSEACREV